MEGHSCQYPAVSLEDLEAIRRFVTETVATLGGNSNAADELVLAINEALANIIIHGYGRQPGYVKVVLGRNDGDIVVTIWIRRGPLIRRPFRRPIRHCRWKGVSQGAWACT